MRGTARNACCPSSRTSVHWPWILFLLGSTPKPNPLLSPGLGKSRTCPPASEIRIWFWCPLPLQTKNTQNIWIALPAFRRSIWMVNYVKQKPLCIREISNRLHRVILHFVKFCMLQSISSYQCEVWAQNTWCALYPKTHQSDCQGRHNSRNFSIQETKIAQMKIWCAQRKCKNQHHWDHSRMDRPTASPALKQQKLALANKWVLLR